MVGPSLNSPKPPTTATATETIKFLCSYGGRILPRYRDGKLRYHGGHTRVLAVNRSISFSELMTKLGELCSNTVRLRCQLPTEDLDALVSITSDEDLLNLIEEYEKTPSLQSSLKIRAFLSIPKKCSPSPTPIPTPTPSTTSASGSNSSTDSPTATSPKSPSPSLSAMRFPVAITKPPVNLPFCYNKAAGKVPYYTYRKYNYGYNRFCVVPTSNQNHWQ